MYLSSLLLIKRLKVALMLPLFIVSSSLWASSFDAKVIRVSDGDTITVRSEQTCFTGENCRYGKLQYRIRLAEIDTPESDQPYGQQATDALSALVAGKTIKIEQTDKDRYGRIIANLYVNGVWVNQELVRDGHAWVYRQYSRSPELYKLESKAKSTQIGLWSLPESERIAPWVWRRMNK